MTEYGPSVVLHVSLYLSMYLCFAFQLLSVRVFCVCLSMCLCICIYLGLSFCAFVLCIYFDVWLSNLLLLSVQHSLRTRRALSFATTAQTGRLSTVRNTSPHAHTRRHMQPS